MHATTAVLLAMLGGGLSQEKASGRYQNNPGLREINCTHDIIGIARQEDDAQRAIRDTPNEYPPTKRDEKNSRVL